MVLDYEFVIFKSFISMENAIYTEIDNFYKNYYSSSKTLYEKSKRMLTNSEYNKFITDVNNWRNVAEEQKLESFLSFCNSLLEKQKITRLEFLQARLMCILEVYFHYFLNFTDSTLNIICIVQHFLQQYLLLHCSKKRFPFIDITMNDCKKIVKKRGFKVTNLENFYNNKRNFEYFIKDTLPKLFAQGEKSNKIKKEISKLFKDFKYSTQFYVRNDTCRICSDIVINICNEHEIKYYTIYCACGDKEEECFTKNNTTNLVDNCKIGVNLPPIKDLCRAFITPCLKDYNITYKDGTFPTIALKNFLIRYCPENYIEYISDYISGL